jgi:hypothetical protein
VGTDTYDHKHLLSVFEQSWLLFLSHYVLIENETSIRLASADFWSVTNGHPGLGMQMRSHHKL